jgi:hypothetical protein
MTQHVVSSKQFAEERKLWLSGRLVLATWFRTSAHAKAGCGEVIVWPVPTYASGLRHTGVARTNLESHRKVRWHTAFLPILNRTAVVKCESPGSFIYV